MKNTALRNEYGLQITGFGLTYCLIGRNQLEAYDLALRLAPEGNKVEIYKAGQPFDVAEKRPESL